LENGISHDKSQKILINLTYFKLSIYLSIYTFIHYCVIVFLNAVSLLKISDSLFYSLMYVLNFIIVFTALSLFQYSAIYDNMCQMCQKQCALYFNAVFHTVLSDICENCYVRDTQCSNRYARR